LGGGVFGDPLPIICEAICSGEDAIIQSGLEGFIVCFNETVYGNAIEFLQRIIGH
jgi:hypothetical protein